MKRILLFCLLSIAFSKKSWAQTESDSIANPNYYRNSVYAELGGNGILPTINYERLIWHPTAQVMYAIRIGGLFIPGQRVGKNLEYEMISLSEITVINGKRAIKFEAGFGVTIYSNSDVYPENNNSFYIHKYYEVVPVIRLGGRWQPFNKPYLIRLGFTPLFLGDKSPVIGMPVVPFGGISLGYSFGKRKNLNA